jgi:hypothetical protein
MSAVIGPGRWASTHMQQSMQAASMQAFASAPLSSLGHPSWNPAHAEKATLRQCIGMPTELLRGAGAAGGCSLGSSSETIQKPGTAQRLFQQRATATAARARPKEFHGWNDSVHRSFASSALGSNITSGGTGNHGEAAGAGEAAFEVCPSETLQATPSDDPSGTQPLARWG